MMKMLKQIMKYPLGATLLRMMKGLGNASVKAMGRIARDERTPVLLKRVALGFLCLFAGSIIVLGSSSLLESAVRHETEMKYLSEQYDPTSSISNIIDWDLGHQPEGRPFTATDGAILGLALTNAWQNLLMAKRSKNERFLEDYFEGTALSNSRKTLNNSVPGVEQGMVVLRQEMKPRFFHLDGSMIELVSDNAVTVRYELDETNDAINFLSINRECPRVVMFLETIGWKVHNQELDCIEKLAGHEERPNFKNLKFPIKGLNYYPANTPWLDFWKNYDDRIILRDLITMHDLGVNTIRVFLPYEYFLDPKTTLEARGKFDRFLAKTKSEGINVIPTLFDFRNYYDPIEWAYEYAYMTGIVEIIRKHDNVILVDLKNEPDIDYKIHGQAKVDLWLVSFSKLLAHLLPDVPLTIGWLSHEHAARMSDIVDVVSYHEYGDPSEAAEIYNQTKANSDGKRVIISELGKPSWGLFAGFPFSPQYQADWLQQQLQALSHADGILIWTLHDFSYEAVGKVADLPWRRAMQAHYGIFDRAGNAKPAVEVFKQYNFQGSDKRPDHIGHDHSILDTDMVPGLYQDVQQAEVDKPTIEPRTQQNMKARMLGGDEAPQ